MHRLKSTTLCCNNTGIRKSEFVAKTQFLKLFFEQRLQRFAGNPFILDLILTSPPIFILNYVIVLYPLPLFTLEYLSTVFPAIV